MNKVEELRKARGWSQVKLSAAADVSVGVIQGIEAGTANPTLSTLRKLAAALDTDWRDLYAGAVA